MAEKSDSRDSDNSWVMTGTEGLPVETMGPEQESASPTPEDEELEEGSTQDTAAAAALSGNGEASFLGQSRGPEESELKDSEECPGPTAGAAPTLAGSAAPSTPDSTTLDGCAQEEPDAEPRPCPDARKAGPLAEEGSCTSSDDDVEGLRRRQVHKPRPEPARPGPAPCRGTQDVGDEDGLNMSKYLLGALALVAVGLLLISSGIYDLADGPTESVVTRDVAEGAQESPLLADGPDSPQKLPSDAGDRQSMQSMSLLLDRLAKENQDIRLMQAELQAHKEELQALLRKSEGEAAAAGAQQQSLAAENAQLRVALQQEAAALRQAQTELQRLQGAGAPGGPQPQAPEAGQPAAEQSLGRGVPAGDEPAVRQEGDRQHGLLASVRQELAGALERARASGNLEQLLEELSALEEQLGQELQVAGAEPFSRPWKKPFKADKKENKRHKRHGTGAVPHEPGERGGREKREQGKPHGHKKDPRPPREHKAGKAWGKASHGAPQRGPRELPPLSQYRAPQGCSGVADCARKEGREVLGVALEPVQKTQFLQLLQGFMGRLGWGGHFAGLAARLEGAFGADGTFAHDRLRFVDFVDDVEELLEDLARREQGDKKAADGFEEFVLRHYAGDGGFVRKERNRKGTQQHGGASPARDPEGRLRG
ncbi:pre-B-cell leukemia transcription factor-interacting protein 1 isoform X2 [Struthio camelus]|uniref:pre-B-cell leukemia transcription factor-interacting protein 1 isoform X2 n=1 Tax=Struthio camelus TaxID=8801 RepID=UPI0036041770